MYICMYVCIYIHTYALIGMCKYLLYAVCDLLNKV